MSEILEILNNSNLSASKEVVSEFDSLDIEYPKRAVSCKELLSIYKRRANHLSHFKTEHAIQLKVSTEELCNNLLSREAEQCFLHTLESSSKHEIILVVSQKTNLLLGCLKTVSKLKVSENEWAQLWDSKS